MICKKCGAQLDDGIKFCPQCGEKIAQPKTGSDKKTVPELISEGERVSDNITLCPDGKYRWVYEMSLIKNPTIFLTVWKIFFFIITGIFGIIIISDWINWDDFFPDRLLGSLKVFVIFIAGMTVLVWVSCLIYAASMGGKYVVIFEMDEQGVNHKQVVWQAQKAAKLSALTTASGAASGNLTTMGVGLNSVRSEMYSEFSKVRKVKVCPRRHLIKVNERLGHNQVYAAPQDFDFVKEYILSHCTNLKR